MCKLHKECNDCIFVQQGDKSCSPLENTDTNKAISVLQKWSDEHPRKTYLDDFKDKFKNARYCDDDIITRFCVKNLYGVQPIDCEGRSYYCEKCWNQPLEEVE